MNKILSRAIASLLAFSLLSSTVPAEAIRGASAPSNYPCTASSFSNQALQERLLNFPFVKMGEQASEILYTAFEGYSQRFNDLSHASKSRFEHRDWQGGKEDAEELDAARVRAIEQAVASVMERFGSVLVGPELWNIMRTDYASKITGLYESDRAETFFNSVLIRVSGAPTVEESGFSTGVNTVPRIEKALKTRIHPVAPYSQERVATAVRQILATHPFIKPYAQLDQRVAAAAEMFDAQLKEHNIDPQTIGAIEMLGHPLFRNNRSYILGRIRTGRRPLPFAMPIRNSSQGPYLDAILLNETEISHLFSSTRSGFLTPEDFYRELVTFFLSILRDRTAAAINAALRHYELAKRLVYEELRQFFAASETFHNAETIRATLMTVFALSGFEYVFKVLMDPPYAKEPITPEEVEALYARVRKIDRAGRMLDAWPIENLREERRHFDPALLKHLRDAASQRVFVQDSVVRIKHLYLQPEVTRLDIYIRRMLKVGNKVAVRRILSDFGYCLKDLAEANIFGGDVQLDNFGVTSYGRVVLFNFAHLDKLTDITFLNRLPRPRDDEDYVSGAYLEDVHPILDVYPPELMKWIEHDLRLIKVPEDLWQEFLTEHGDLFADTYWHNTQTKIRLGTIAEFREYPESRRLKVPVPDGNASVASPAPGATPFEDSLALMRGRFGAPIPGALKATLDVRGSDNAVSEETVYIPADQWPAAKEDFARYLASRVQVRGVLNGASEVGISFDGAAGELIELTKKILKAEFGHSEIMASYGEGIRFVEGPLPAEALKIYPAPAASADYRSGLAVGIDIGGSNIKFVVWRDGEPVHSEMIRTDAARDALGTVLEQKITTLESFDPLVWEKPLFITVPGVVKPDGTILISVRLQSAVRSLENLQKKHPNIHFVNDAKTAIAYQMAKRTMQPPDDDDYFSNIRDFIGNTLGTGLGLAIAPGGRIITGPQEAHLRVNFSPTAIVNPGFEMAGDLESYANQEFILLRAQELAQARSIWTLLPTPPAHVKEIEGWLSSGNHELNRISMQVFREFGEHLAILYREIALIEKIGSWVVILTGGIAQGSAIQFIKDGIVDTGKHDGLFFNVIIGEEAQYSGALGAAFYGLQAQNSHGLAEAS